MITHAIAAGSAPPNIDDLLATILSTAGMHTRALDALLTVSRVQWSDEIASACVECCERPRLLLNPQFVARYCTTPERLTMLVLHELSHVMLGHTRLFPRPTTLHNIAFDAIVNRTVLSLLEASHAAVRRYAALPMDTYRPDRSPEFILRPPPDWPDKPDWKASRKMPAALRRIHRMLYGEGVRDAGLLGVTYGEIIEALQGTVSNAAADDVELLGAHGVTLAEQSALAGTRNADVAEVLQPQLNALAGLVPGDGDALTSRRVRDVGRTPSLERALRVLMRRAGHGDGTATRRVEWTAREVCVVHRLHDRRAASRHYAARVLGAPAPMLFAGRIAERKLEKVGVTIYVDVSGSMHSLLPHLRRALHALREEIRPTLYWFSTTVVRARANDLATGRVRSTGGTSITAVIRHIATSVPAGTPVVILTDGYVESVNPAVQRQLQTHGTRIHLGVIGAGPLHDGARWVTSSTRLPTATESR
ncbi:MAG: VWA domain-containing protein [Gemmatimonadota bacterium]